MSKPNASTEGVLATFTEIQIHLKHVQELLDIIQSQPYIPSIRQNALAHCSDKVENLQQNIHSLSMNLAHWG